ncbi:MAG: hypothetical protein ACT4QF_20830 [Sporichthyaceae bacterium]
MADDPELAARLADLTTALAVLASTERTDDARTIAERREAVRTAGEAFEMQLSRRCVSYLSLFAVDDDEGDDEDEDEGEGSFRISIDDDVVDDWDYEDVPEGTRMSVQVREDFVLVHEQEFRASAMQVFQETGPWPPEVEPNDDATRYLMALVDAIGLPEVVFGGRVAGLEPLGGQTQVQVVDSAE